MDNLENEKEERRQKFLQEHPEWKVKIDKAISKREERVLARKEKREKIFSLRNSINPQTGRYHTHLEIAQMYGVTKQRIQQVVGSLGRKNFVPEKVFEFTCESCGRKFFRLLKDSEKGRKYAPKNCSAECGARARATIIKGKLKKEFTEEDWKKWKTFVANRKSAIEGRRRYFLKNKDKLYEDHRRYGREYSKRPEVRAKVRAAFKHKYKNDTVFRERYLEKQRIKQREKYATDKLSAKK